MSKNSGNKLDQLVAETRRQQDERAQTYRGLALKLFPWICGRCGREFTHTNLRELTVHHKNHDHDDNPADGSNWELLCLYCHDNEHQRQLEIHGVGTGGNDTNHKSSTRKPFANLKDLLNKN
ncbi:MAG: YajD family HNH nuclease [Gammaproteobacteria bacterium]|nr:YajD family HNH nuclease [Gammaproteobacteria bacterium]